MTTRQTFFQRITQFSERVAHERTRRYLVGLDDRNLEDMGFSRELLEQGPKAWPWRVPGETYGAHRPEAYLRNFSSEAESQAPVRSPRIEPTVRVSSPDFDAKKAA
jgi:uncharacterized protein YjiS (DUF1127 family)